MLLLKLPRLMGIQDYPFLSSKEWGRVKKYQEIKRDWPRVGQLLQIWILLLSFHVGSGIPGQGDVSSWGNHKVPSIHGGEGMTQSQTLRCDQAWLIHSIE